MKITHVFLGMSMQAFITAGLTQKELITPTVTQQGLAGCFFLFLAIITGILHFNHKN